MQQRGVWVFIFFLAAIQLLVSRSRNINIAR